MTAQRADYQPGREEASARNAEILQFPTELDEALRIELGGRAYGALEMEADASEESPSTKKIREGDGFYPSTADHTEPTYGPIDLGEPYESHGFGD